MGRSFGMHNSFARALSHPGCSTLMPDIGVGHSSGRIAINGPNLGPALSCGFSLDTSCCFGDVNLIDTKMFCGGVSSFVIGRISAGCRCGNGLCGHFVRPGGTNGTGLVNVRLSCRHSFKFVTPTLGYVNFCNACAFARSHIRSFGFRKHRGRGSLDLPNSPGRATGTSLCFRGGKLGLHLDCGFTSTFVSRVNRSAFRSHCCSHIGCLSMGTDCAFTGRCALCTRTGGLLGRPLHCCRKARSHAVRTRCCNMGVGTKFGVGFWPTVEKN